MKKVFWILILMLGLTGEAFTQIGWWTSSDTLNVFNKNKGSILIGSYQPLGKLTVGPDDKFYNLALVGDYNNLAKNYLQIGVTGRGFENLQGQTIFDLYHSNSQPKNAGYNFRINGNSQFFINGEGNIGIGTEKPEAKLDLSGGPNWGGFTKALRIPGEHVIKFETSGSEYGIVATGGMLNIVMSNQNESTNPFGVPFSRIMSLQRNKVVIEGDIEVKGKIYSQGQTGNGGDLPIDNGGSGGGPVDNGKDGGGGIFALASPAGTISAPDWQYNTTGNVNDIFYVYNSGKVGIGTTSPSYKLQVQSDVGDRQIYVNGGIQVGAYTTLQTHTELDNSYRRLLLASGAYYDWTNNRYQLTNAPYDRAAFEILNGGHISFKTESSNRSSLGYMTLAAWDSTERMRITNAGNVGIGTTSPSYALDLYRNGGSSTIVQRLWNPNTSWGAESLIRSYSDSYNTAFPAVDFGYYRGISSDATSGFIVKTGTVASTTIKFIINQSGSVGIGTVNPGTDKLAVNGTIRAKELYLTTSGWSDFVFEQGYNLRTLKQVENYIKKNGHLPEIPSQKEVEEKGVGVISMQAKLLQKIEELTLYMIEQNKRLEKQELEIKSLREQGKKNEK